MVKRKEVYKILSIVLIILIVTFSSLYYFSSNNSKALLDVKLYGWAVNEENNSQMYFGYEICNYGDEEARNVNIKCVIKDELVGEISSSIQEVGNIASETSSYKEFYSFDNSLETEITENSTAVCYVDSCENCEILYKNIPELVEYYEG